MRTTTHPGEILKEEFLVPMGITAHALAMALKVPATRISEIIRGRRGITADTALRLSRYFGNTPQFWLNLQQSHDLSVVVNAVGNNIAREVSPHAA
ncbi:MAG: HigA family addiction module antitoxin [Magnetococcus sp. DMHC-1]|nr:HigA family addiction module antidote protein [Magnetococcales bacterium]